jgi:hypothetical protein
MGTLQRGDLPFQQLGWTLPDEFATLRCLLEARLGKPGSRQMAAHHRESRFLCATLGSENAVHAGNSRTKA